MDEQTLKKERGANGGDTERSTKRSRRENSRCEHGVSRMGSLPSADMYERSYMHRDVVTHVEFAPRTRALLTASRDGVVKLWVRSAASATAAASVDDKKCGSGGGEDAKVRRPLLDFVKQWRAHTAALSDVRASEDGALAATSSALDGTIKVFDLLAFDLVYFVRPPRAPAAVEWTSRRSRVGVASTLLVVASATASALYLYRLHDLSPYRQLDTLHQHATVALRRVPQLHALLSIDSSGDIELWTPSPPPSEPEAEGETEAKTNADREKAVESDTDADVQLPDGVSFCVKSETDLYALQRAGSGCEWLSVSRDGRRFAVYGSDARVRVWSVRTGRLVCELDESAAQIARCAPLAGVNSEDVARRSARELQLTAAPQGMPFSAETTRRGVAAEPTQDGAPAANAQLLRFVQRQPRARCVEFGDDNAHLVVSSALGLKIVDLKRARAVKFLGAGEHALRFGSFALCSVPVELAGSVQLMDDPMIAAAAFDAPRIYLFTAHEPREQPSLAARDVINEFLPSASLRRPHAPQLHAREPSSSAASGGAVTKNEARAHRVTLHTSVGDIELQLDALAAPRTVLNFELLCRRRYYDGVVFHRVIRGFMVQTGDPLGDGTGGESAWGGTFEDEVHSARSHDRAGVLSMANAGPNTNGSQFFLTTAACASLDGKHSIFGSVTRGMPVLHKIECARTDRNDRPLVDIVIVSTTVHDRD